MPKGKSYATDQKKGGLVPLETHRKRAKKQQNDKNKGGGGRGGAPGHWG